jgi:hypothetical protein
MGPSSTKIGSAFDEVGGNEEMILGALRKYLIFYMTPFSTFERLSHVP